MHHHDHDAALRARSIRDGAIATWATALITVAYVALTWSEPHRPLLLAIAVAACLEAALVVGCIGPRLRTATSFHRFFFAWGTVHVAVIAWLCMLDGGVSSPFVAVFLLSVAVGGGALPRGSVMALAAVNAGAVVVVALLDMDHGHFHAETFVWGGVLLVVAGVSASIAEHRTAHAAELLAAREELPRRLARVVEYRDDDTGGHVERIAVHAEAIAQALGLPPEACRRIRLASPMHDIGKVAVPDAILLKPGPLTPEERARMQTHARAGHEMLSGSGSDLLDLAATIALTHHERYDGTGYPSGLRGTEIPLEGRIVAVADVFDAVTSKRVYKDAVDVRQAVAIIRQGRGTQFDPRVVDAFDQVVDGLVPAALGADAPPTAPGGEPAEEHAGARDARPPAVAPRADVLQDPGRLAELDALGILDTAPEADFDDLAALAAAVCRSPVAAVNFVDGTRHFSKAVAGLPGASGTSVPNELSFCAATVRTPGGVLVVPDTHADERWREHPMVLDGPRVGFYAGVTISSRGAPVGVVCAFGEQPRTVTPQERLALTTLARQAERQLGLRRRSEELRGLALSDPLTGLANRRLLTDRLEQALIERGRTGDEVGVVFCDVDDFKGVNDRFGHEAGDRLLCDVAGALRAVARETDTVARIAGDEFVLVCPHVDGEEGLRALAGRLARETAEQPPMADGTPPPRLSIGAVLARPGESAAEVLRRADVEMYRGKTGARRAVPR